MTTLLPNQRTNYDALTLLRTSPVIDLDRVALTYPTPENNGYMKDHVSISMGALISEVYASIINGQFRLFGGITIGNISKRIHTDCGISWRERPGDYYASLGDLSDHDRALLRHHVGGSDTYIQGSISKTKNVHDNIDDLHTEMKTKIERAIKNLQRKGGTWEAMGDSAYPTILELETAVANLSATINPLVKAAA